MSLASILGIKEPPKAKIQDTWKKPSIGLFDFVNAITNTKQTLIVDEWSEKQYDPFMINRALSMGPDTVVAANEMNSRNHIPRRAQHDFLFHFIRARKRYNQWIKSDTDDKVALVQKYFTYSESKARAALRLLREEDLQYMRERLTQGGRVKG